MNTASVDQENKKWYKIIEDRKYSEKKQNLLSLCVQYALGTLGESNSKDI